MRAHEPSTSKPAWIPLIEGYLDYLADGEPQGAADGHATCAARCGSVCAAMESIRPGVPLWKLTLEDYHPWLEQERQAGRTAAHACASTSAICAACWTTPGAAAGPTATCWTALHLQDADAGGCRQALSDRGGRAAGAGLPEPHARWSGSERMMVLLLYGCGLRTDELCRLNVEDVDRRAAGTVRSWHGKGDRQRMVPDPGGGVHRAAGVPAGAGRQARAAVADGGKRRPDRRRRMLCEVVRRAAERAGHRQAGDAQDAAALLRHAPDGPRAWTWR